MKNYLWGKQKGGGGVILKPLLQKSKNYWIFGIQKSKFELLQSEKRNSNFRNLKIEIRIFAIQKWNFRNPKIDIRISGWLKYS